MTPEFRALFGGIDPEVAGTTPEKVQEFARSLGMDWKPTPKPTADEFLDTKDEPVNETEQPQDEPQPEDLQPNAGAQSKPDGVEPNPVEAASPAPMQADDLPSDYTFSKSFSRDPDFLAGVQDRWRNLFGKEPEQVTDEDIDRLVKKNKWASQTRDNLFQQRAVLKEAAARAAVPPAPIEPPHELPPVQPLTHATTVSDFAEQWTGAQNTQRELQQELQAQSTDLLKQANATKDKAKKTELKDQAVKLGQTVNAGAQQVNEHIRALAATYDPEITQAATAQGITDPETLAQVREDFWRSVTESPALEANYNAKFGDVLKNVLANYQPAPVVKENLTTEPAKAAPVSATFAGDIASARKWALENLRGSVVNKATGLPIEISRKGIVKVLSESAAKKSANLQDHVDAIRHVPQLLADAQLAEARIAQKKTQDIANILRFHAPLEVNGNRYTARLTVREHIHPQGRKFYTYELMELEKEKPAGNSVNAPPEGERSTADSGPHPGKTGGEVKVTPKTAKVNTPAAPSAPAFKVGDKLEHNGKIKTVTRPSFNPKYVVLDGKMVSASETRPPQTKQVDKPVEAAAKAQDHVTDVAQTEGQRPAKEVKSELVRRIEEEIAKLPPRQEFFHTEPRTTRGKREFYSSTADNSLRVRTSENHIGYGWTIESEKTSGKTGLIERKKVGEAGGDISGARAAAETALEKLQNPKLGKVTIDIPGDGKFTIDQTHAALNEVLARAKALDTRSTIKPTVRKTGSDRAMPGDLTFSEEDWQKPETIAKLEAALAKPQTEENRRVLLAALEQAKKLQGVTEEPPPKSKVAGFGSAPLTRKQKISVPGGVAGTAAPPVNPLRQYFTAQAAGVQSVAAPQTLGSDARKVANALRHFLGVNATAEARASAALDSWRAEFAKTPVPDHWVYDPAQPLPHNYAVIDALEQDRAGLPARYKDLADVFDREFAWRIREIQKFAPHALQHLLQYYFPHVWQDPQRAAPVMAQIATRLFAGRKEFLKQRSLPMFRDGLAEGLKPISDSPVDLLMAKMHSMDKFLLALRATAEFRGSGAMRFKYLFERLAPGDSIVDDPAFIVQRPPIVTVKEAVDQFQRAKLGEILQDLGVSYKRVASLGGKRWAEADQGLKEIRAKVGASEDILWHELGHHLDWKFPELRDLLGVRGNTPLAQQLRALVDLNHPGTPHNPKKSYHRYLRRDEEKIAEVFRAYAHAPQLFQKTAPDVWKALKTFLDTQPGLRDKLNEMANGRMGLGSESTEIKLGGMQQLGHWVMPTPAAMVIKNYLSPSLSRFGAYRAFRSASNILNGAQLGLSGFHLGFTSLDAMVSRLAVALEDLTRGKPLSAAKTAATVPVSFITNAIQGHQIRKEALQPGSTTPEIAAIVKAMEMGGGRVGQDAFWKTNFSQRAMRWLRLARQAMNDLDAYHTGKALTFAGLQLPLAAIEQSMRPVLDFVVPRQKLGVFADMARREIERLGPNASLDATREAMRRAWDSVDNRMGQVVYDNHFYNRTLKDMLLLTFRAWGWQQGKFGELGGAGIDAAKFLGTGAQRLLGNKQAKPEVTHKMAYAAALAGMVALLGAILTRLFTGRNPHGQDYVMPPTGETDSRGNGVRLNLPSYAKDVVAYGKHPATTVAHSLNPLYSEMWDFMQNKDFYGVEIRHPDDPLLKQAGQISQWAAKQFLPFSISGTMKMQEDGAPAWKQVAPYFGFTPVPARMTMTPAQELATDLTAQGMGDAPRTQEQFDKSKLLRQLAQQMKTNAVAGKTNFTQAVKDGKLNMESMGALMDKAQYNPLQFQVLHLDVPAAMKVWRVASPEEQAQLHSLLAIKILNAKTLSLEQKQGFAKELAR